jgi:SAM-dependent methyltransferase
MAVDQSRTRADVPERFSPADMSGQLLEAEHLARYRWAATIASGKRVLDAGCGTAYGTAILAESEATEVVGVDLAASVLDSVRAEMPENVELLEGDLTQLELEDGRFDLVVCFEVIEHFRDPQVVLDHLVRVLAPGGVLLVSSPNRGVYPGGNPHHHHEFKPQELEADLQRRLSNVRLMRQQSYVTAAILDEAELATGRQDELEGVRLSKLPVERPGSELFTLAVATDTDLPGMPSLAMMTARVALDDWVEASRGQERALQDNRRRIQELESKVADHRQLEQRLIESEHRLSIIPRLILEVEELDEVRSARDSLLESARELQAAKASFSWRVTRPLREGKGFFARFRRR